MLWAFYIREKQQEEGPKHPLKKSYSKCFGWTQIRCKRWFPNGGSSLVWSTFRHPFLTSFKPQFYLCFTSILPAHPWKMSYDDLQPFVTFYVNGENIKCRKMSLIVVNVFFLAPSPFLPSPFGFSRVLDLDINHGMFVSSNGMPCGVQGETRKIETGAMRRLPQGMARRGRPARSLHFLLIFSANSLLNFCYTPARNYREINSENIISCNWNEIFQEKSQKNVSMWFSESQTNTWYVIFGKLIPENYFLALKCNVSGN